jgi:hypothetical protein
MVQAVAVKRQDRGQPAMERERRDEGLEKLAPRRAPGFGAGEGGGYRLARMADIDADIDIEQVERAEHRAVDQRRGGSSVLRPVRQDRGSATAARDRHCGPARDVGDLHPPPRENAGQRVQENRTGMIDDVFRQIGEGRGVKSSAQFEGQGHGTPGATATAAGNRSSRTTHVVRHARTYLQSETLTGPRNSVNATRGRSGF